MKAILRHSIPIICCAALLAFGVSAHADVDKHARNISASCAACHGTDGNSVGGTPVLAGLDKTYFIKQMQEFKSGVRPATVMHQHAKGYTDEEFALMADFFAAQKRAPTK